MRYTENTEPPYLYRKWVGLSCIAAALQRKVWLKAREDLIWYPNLFVVLVGPSGKARKGTAMSTGERMLRDVGIKVASEAITREALIRELGESTSVEVMEDGTTIPHTSLTVYSKELTVFLGYNHVQLLMDLTDWYDCAQHWTYRTKNAGTDEIEGLWFNLIGATTPDLIQSSMPENFIGGGFTSRTIFVYESQVGKRIVPWATLDDEGLYKELLEDLEEIHQMIGPFQMSQEFNDTYTEYYLNIDKEPAVDHHLFSGYNERRAQNLLKVAMCLSAADNSDLLLMKKHFDEADELLSQTEHNMPRAFSGVGSGKNNKLMVAVLTFMGKKHKATKKELIQRFRSEMDDMKQLNDMILLLQNAGALKEEVRQSDTYLIANPDNPQMEKFWHGRNGQL